MKETCSYCGYVFLIPKGLDVKDVICPKCKRSLKTIMTEKKTKRGRSVVVFVVLACCVGFGLGVVFTKANKEETQTTLAPVTTEIVKENKEDNLEIVRMRRPIEQLQKAIRLLNIELQEALMENEQLLSGLDKINRMEEEKRRTDYLELAPQKKDGKIITGRAWRKIGFPNFCDIPRKGKVPRLKRMAVGQYGGVYKLKIFQIFGAYEMLVKGAALGKRGKSGRFLTGNKQLNEIIRIKGFSTEGLVNRQEWEGYMYARVHGGYSQIYESKGRYGANIEVGKRSFTLPVTAEIAIIGTWTYTTAAGSQNTIFTAIPLDFVRKGLREEELQQLLK